MNWKALKKIASGIIVVPLGIIMSMAWPWWEKLPKGPKKYLSGIVILPLALVILFAAPWWENLKME
jgi:hypothetical protein